MAKKIGKGKLITELVKGSMDYTMNLIQNAFHTQFPYQDGGENYSVNEIFSDHVIVSSWENTELKTDEYFKVTYSKSGDAYTFATRDQWEIVELTYQPQTTPSQIGEKTLKKKGKRFEERVDARLSLQEAEAGKPRRIKINGAITANVVNGNKRRYPVQVLSAAVEELRGHLNESAGQGRAVQILGEAEHPSDKGGRPNLLETVTKWEEVSFDGQRVDVVGRILETSRGKDILTLMEGGVLPGVSLRGYGEGQFVKENGRSKEEKIFEVSELHITGFDLVLEPSFENSAELMESIQGDKEMTIEELLKLMKERPELFEGMNEAQIKKMGETQLKALEEQIRSALGIDANANIAEALKSATGKAKQFDDMQAKTAVDAAITEATKELPYGKDGNKNFVEAVQAANLSDAAAVKTFIESKRKEYDKIYSKKELVKQGFQGGAGLAGIRVIGDVLEEETDTPEFARASFELVESIRRVELKSARKLNEAKTPSEIYTKLILARFDKLNMQKLMAENRALEEAELTTDLDLAATVSRSVIAAALPDLIAAGIFDMGTIDSSPTNLYYEKFVGESGYTAALTAEAISAKLGVWVALTKGRLSPDSVVVTASGGSPTYVEGTDYVVDYAGGRVMALTGGAIADNDSIKVTTNYTAIRKGEMAPIERGKVTLAHMVITAAADRLAAEISREAIVFSRSQMGFDVVARTLANLVNQLRRLIDQGILYSAYAAVKSVAGNGTTAWTIGTTQDSLAEFVRLLGTAKVMVGNRWYTPSFYLMSTTNADRLSHWEGFTRAGFPNAVLDAAGFAGGVNGLPIFAGTEFPNSLAIAGNRELVQYRVFSPMIIKGPYPTYAIEGDTSRLVAADQYYAEEFNTTNSPVPEKGAYVPIEEAGGS
jgi:hypothetical protein